MGVVNGPSEVFFSAMHEKFSGGDGRTFLVVVDGCEGHLALGDSVVPQFLSHLAGKAGGLSFLITSVQPLGFMHNLSEKVGVHGAGVESCIVCLVDSALRGLGSSVS